LRPLRSRYLEVRWLEGPVEIEVEEVAMTTAELLLNEASRTGAKMVV